MSPFDMLDGLHGVEWTPELEAAEREHQEESDRGAQMLAGVMILALIFGACWLGWRFA